MKKIGKTALMIVGALLVCAVGLGVVNGLAADGAWTFGWLDYRYEGQYEVGSGSVAGSNREELKKLCLDWLDGSVRVIPCDDALISLTEDSSKALTEGDELRWGFSEDGRTLTVMYRKSAWYFEGTRGEGKSLILRIPRKILAQLEEIEISTRGAEVYLENLETNGIRIATQRGNVKGVGCAVENLNLTSKRGDLQWDGTVVSNAALQTERGSVTMKDTDCPEVTQVKTENGKVSLTFGEQASFALQWSTEGGSAVSDFTLTEGADGKLICGDGASSVVVETKNGDLWIYKSTKTAD